MLFSMFRLDLAKALLPILKLQNVEPSFATCGGSNLDPVIPKRAFFFHFFFITHTRAHT